jgi:hypothetical protein
VRGGSAIGAMSGMGCASLGRGIEDMEKSLTRQTFGVPSQSVLEHKFARLSEAENAYKTKLRELEKQFESKAAALREAYLAAVLEIHEVATSSICYRQ